MLLEWVLGPLLYALSCLPRTPLHAAAFADNIHGLQLLLRHQAEVDTTDKLGRTPLMMASENGHTAAVGTWPAGASPGTWGSVLLQRSTMLCVLHQCLAPLWGEGRIYCVGNVVFWAVPRAASHPDGAAAFPGVWCEPPGPLLSLGPLGAGHLLHGSCPSLFQSSCCIKQKQI